jgi:predicted Kef-type K+ transport protein
MHLGLLSQDANGLIMAGALISIALNPFFFHLTDWLGPQIRKTTALNHILLMIEASPGKGNAPRKP